LQDADHAHSRRDTARIGAFSVISWRRQIVQSEMIEEKCDQAAQFLGAAEMEEVGYED
jgi:hypothetical protein